MLMQTPEKWRNWNDLDADAQVELREEYGRYLDTQPPTCDLEIKIERFRDWLAMRCVRYPGSGRP
jgi:hypothetical protein